MPKRNIKSKKSKKYSKKKMTKRKQKRNIRKNNYKISKKLRGGEAPNRERREDSDEEMLVPPEEVQNEEDVGQQVNQLITRILDLGFIEQDTRPEFVYNVMTRMITLWNYVFNLYTEGVLTEENVDQLRIIIDSIYDRIVRVAPQEGEVILDQQGEEPLPEIINRRSSAILSDLFDYVANITSTDRGTRINDIIIVRDYETTYGEVPNEDNPDFTSDNEEEGSQNNSMDVSH